jgi:hypothetical protein
LRRARDETKKEAASWTACSTFSEEKVQIMKLKLWRCALLFGAFATLAGSFSASAQEVSELRCRGNDNPLVDIFVIDKLDSDTLSLNFNSSPRAAGPDSKGLNPGTCSWIDRTLKEDEWRQIHFMVTAAQAESIPVHLKNPKNYWSFFVITSDRGYFEAKSHKVWTVETKPETSAMPSPNESQPNTPPAQPNTPPAQPNTPPAQPNTPPAQPNTPPTQPNTPPASFGGKWNMASGPGSTQFTLSLQQAGSKVTGTFSPQDGTIEGTVTGKMLSFQWTQAGGYKGSGQLDMNSDGKSMTGVFTIVEGPKKGENKVSASRAEETPQPAPQPSTPPVSFAGTWETVAGGEYKYTMKLQQTGDQVTGTFAPGSGTLEGTVLANVLRLHFTQNQKFKGSARLVLADDGKTFSGTTNAGDDPDANGQDWKGSRQSTSINTSTTPPVKFAGRWDIVSNGTNKYVVTLEQTGDKVTGTFAPGGKIENGVVEGNVLNFEWTQDGGYVGFGRWDMSATGKAFSGSMSIIEGPSKGVVPTTGTRQIRLRVPKK